MRISVSDDGGMILSINVNVCDEKHRTQNIRYKPYIRVSD